MMSRSFLNNRTFLVHAVWALCLASVVASTNSCTPVPPENQASKTTAGGASKLNPQGGVLRQCDYRLGARKSRTTIFATLSRPIVQRVVLKVFPDDQKEHVVITEVLESQGPQWLDLVPQDQANKILLPSPESVQAPVSGECASCSISQRTIDPTTLKVGETVYLPVGTLESAESFDTAYVAFRIEEKTVLSKNNPLFADLKANLGQDDLNLEMVGDNALVHLTGTFSQVHGTFHDGKKKTTRPLSDDEVARLVSHSPVFKGQANASDLDLKDKAFVGWAMGVDKLSHKYRITVPGLVFPLNHKDNPAGIAPNRPAQSEGVSKKNKGKFFSDIDLPVYLVDKCTAQGRRSVGSGYRPIVGGSVTANNIGTIKISTFNIRGMYDYYLDMNLSTGEITYRSGVTFAYKTAVPPSEGGGDAVLYAKLLTKMIDYLTYARNGQIKGNDTYNSCPQLDNAVEYLEEVKRKTKPRFLTEPMISLLNAFEFFEY